MAQAQPKPPPDELEIPEYSSGRVITLDMLEAQVLVRIAAYWTRLKGTRKFPARGEVTPRDLGKLLRHVMLVKVVDGDYGFRIVGDVQVQAYGESYQGMRLSDIALTHRKFAEGTKIFYDASRFGGYAFGYRGWIGRDMPDTRYSYHEMGFFPLGPDEVTVDHLLVAGIYVPRGEFQSE